MKRLVVVYSADAGYVNALIDAVQKVVSPSTYECNLCAVTYGAATMKPEWRRYLESLDLPVEFLHRNEYQERHDRADVSLPIILLEDGATEPIVLLDAETINGVHTVADLTDLIEERLNR
ncbi:MAG: hypothetical protein WBW88_13885 [Rhodothermales bacterium]